ncbi:MAG: SRPBCC family protein [Capnocytophaga sp.]|nr:SRPBCC family protein [Capnocytophaga sp.]
MKIEIPQTTVSQNNIILFEKLENPTNFKQLMPDNLATFEVLDENSFSFSLKGMPEIVLEKKNTTPHSELIYGAKGGKIPFNLFVKLTKKSETETDVQFSFEGDFNPMMAMMVKAPISKLIQTMTEKTQNL